MKRFALLPLVTAFAAGSFATGYRINQDGRIMPAQPVVTSPILFNTHSADTIVDTLQIFPVTNAWNEDISRLPLLSNSAAMISDITSELTSSRRTLRIFTEMNYVMVPDNQPLVPISFVDYADQSDPGPYPIPSVMPIESWPVGDGAGQTLSQWQHDVFGDGGDRHGIVVEPGTGNLYETWQEILSSDGSWSASNGAKFNLKSNALRPDTWTSGDAAGFPMFPALIRYDECERGMVEHAMRLCIKHTRQAHIYPATHDASKPVTTNGNVPAMGQRLRLKGSFVIPSTWTKEEKAVCLGLKKYGCMVADNGNFFSMSCCPDQRFPAGCFDDFQASMAISNFEVVQTTGPTGGPRSPNPPIVNAGARYAATVGKPITLSGKLTGGVGTVAIQWAKYSGLGNVVFGNAASLGTTATFSAKGGYVLMLKASDGVHAAAYDAVLVVVS